MRDGGKSIDGHIYAGVFDAEKWIIVDASKHQVDVDIEKDNRIIFDEGLDSWDIGIDSFDTLSKKFNEFRENN